MAGDGAARAGAACRPALPGRGAASERVCGLRDRGDPRRNAARAVRTASRPEQRASSTGSTTSRSSSAAGEQARPRPPKDLYRRLEADIGRTKEGWLETEQKLVAAYKQYVDKQAAELKPKAEDRAFLMKRWLDLRDADGKLEGPGARRGLSARTRGGDALALPAAAQRRGRAPGPAGRQPAPTQATQGCPARAARGVERLPEDQERGSPRASSRAQRGGAGPCRVPRTAGIGVRPPGRGGKLAERPHQRGEVLRNGDGQNVAHAQASGDAAVAAWIKSPGHEANLVDRSMKHVGFGYAIDAVAGTSGVFGAPKS